jgi:hypothetical protein
MILAYEQEPDFTSGLTSFVQALVYKTSGGNMLSAMCTYKEGGPAGESSDFDAREKYHSIDIMEGGGRAKGILVSTLITGVDFGENYRPVYRSDKKGQPAGSVKAYYMLMDRTGDSVVLKQPVRSIGSEYLPGNARYIEISGSNCLFDPRAPLRYGLASAFDNDPSTSYVENTENDKMNITIHLNPEYFKRCVIVNGYAQDMALYKSNNRVKSLWIGDRKRELLDDSLAYQYVDRASQNLSVSDIYRGEKYNDTCIAEYNVYADGIGWLFGDINE